jgi:hypothetical protein
MGRFCCGLSRICRWSPSGAPPFLLSGINNFGPRCGTEAPARQTGQLPSAKHVSDKRQFAMPRFVPLHSLLHVSPSCCLLRQPRSGIVALAVATPVLMHRVKFQSVQSFTSFVFPPQICSVKKPSSLRYCRRLLSYRTSTKSLRGPHHHHHQRTTVSGKDIQMGENTTQEAPFPLTEVDKWVLSQTDDEFTYHTWDELRNLLRTVDHFRYLSNAGPLAPPRH